jgi:transposase
MTKLDARKLSARQQENLRRRAVELVEDGMAQAGAARDLGVSRSAIAGWMSAWRKAGESALVSRLRGRPSGTGILSAEGQTEVLNVLLNRMPDDFGIDARLWNYCGAAGGSR